MTATLGAALPQLFVSDLAASLAYLSDVLGFDVLFRYGSPPYYAQVRRGAAQLCVRHVDTPVMDRHRSAREDHLAAHISVRNLQELHAELLEAGAVLHQAPRQEPWGAETFIVAHLDGNLLLFAEG